MKSKDFIYKLITTLSLMVICPLLGVCGDSAWGDNKTEFSFDEISVASLPSESQDIQAETPKKKQFWTPLKKNEKQSAETDSYENIDINSDISINKQTETPKKKSFWMPLKKNKKQQPETDSAENFDINSDNSNGAESQTQISPQEQEVRQNYKQLETPAEKSAVVRTTGNSNSGKTLKDIEIHGANVINSEIILTQINLKKGEAYDREVVQEGLKSIYQLGYFSEKMRAIPVNNPDGTITLKIILEENAPVTDFTIEGNTVMPTEELLPYLIEMKGKPQNIAQLNDAIAKIQQSYAAKGFILARVESVSDDPDGTVNINIKEGTINKILIAGNEKTKDFVIERNVLSEPGMVYNENLLKEDIVRLYASQAFKDVTREIEPCADIPDAYNITINVQEQRTASISVGGGLDSVTGVFGSVGIADNNFRGMNQRLSLNGLVGSGVILNDASIKRRMNMQVELSFFEPHFLNADTSLMSKLFFRDFGSYQVPLAIERRFGGEVTVAHRMNKINKNLSSSLSLGVENIDVREGDFNKIASLYQKYNIPITERAKQLDGGLFMSISPALIYDTREGGAVTRKGTLASLRFDEEIGVLDFNKTHGKITGSIKQYIPIGQKSSLSFTAKGGGKIHGDNMPEVMMYRLGGPYTIRGFKMSGVGTGDAFIMGSAEFATPIPFVDRTRLARKVNFLNNIRLTAWVDAGRIFNPTVTNTIYDRPLSAITAGVGMKLYIPGMGPLSIDYGIPFTNSGENGNPNGYFTFGVGDLMY